MRLGGFEPPTSEDVRLPDDLAALAELVERERAVWVIVDSLYNALAPTVKPKDEEVAVVPAQLKAELCHRTGAGAALVDHSPWPCESNKGQRRAYGSVFKTAAVRWSIHLEADAKDDTLLHVEASGNNVAGFRRTPASWDEQALEIRLLEVEAERPDEELEAEVLAFLSDGELHSTSAIRKAVTGRPEHEGVGQAWRLEAPADPAAQGGRRRRWAARAGARGSRQGAPRRGCAEGGTRLGPAHCSATARMRRQQAIARPVASGRRRSSRSPIPDSRHRGRHRRSPRRHDLRRWAVARG